MPDDDKRPTPDWDERITLQEASAISGLAVKHLQTLAYDGKLRTDRMGARLRVTTRRWLDEYLRSRGASHPGPAPKALPPDYVSPPRRGRPPKKRHAATAPETPV